MGNLLWWNTRQGAAGDAPAPIKVKDKNNTAYFAAKKLRTFFLVLKFVYRLKNRIKMRKYILDNEYMLTIENAKNDLVMIPKEKLSFGKHFYSLEISIIWSCVLFHYFVKLILRNLVHDLSGGLKAFKKPQPFEEKRKLNFKGMVKLQSDDKDEDSFDQYQGTWLKLENGQEVIHGRGVYIYENTSQFVGYFYENKIWGTFWSISYLISFLTLYQWRSFVHPIQRVL